MLTLFAEKMLNKLAFLKISDKFIGDKKRQDYRNFLPLIRILSIDQ